MERENYYLILELPLDPPELDPKNIAKAIEAKRVFWNSKVNHPQFGLKYKYYVEQIGVMKQFLIDDEKSRENRQKEMEKAFLIVQKQLSEMLIVVSSKGYVTETEIAKIAKALPQLKTETIRSKITVEIKKADAGFTPPKPPPPLEPGIKPTDMAKMNSIENFLLILKKDNLYDVLGCPPVASIQALQQSASELLEKMRKKTNKTADVSALQELAGLAKTIFANEAGKKGYDLALKNYRIESHLIKMLDLRVDDKAKKVNRVDYLQSIDDALEVGMTKQEAEFFVYNYFCVKRKVPYPMPPENEKISAPKESCPVCFALNDQTALNCNKCGSPLHVKCPKCGKDSTLTNAFCQCGFHLGDMPIALTALKEARHLLTDGDLSEAENMVRKALLFWPNNPDAEILRKELAAMRKENTLKESGKHLANLALPKSFLAETSLNNTINLQWTPASFINDKLGSDKSQISYLVVRKKGAVPSSPEDGDSLIETPATKFEDTHAEIGQIYGYAIFPCYLGIAKKNGVFSKKVLIIHDLFNLRILAGDSQMQLSWEPPSNVIEIICRRKCGGLPSGVSDGEKVSVNIKSKSIIDSGLENDVTYGYWLACVFQGPDGEKITSRGVTASGTPTARPPDVENMHYSVTSNGIEFSWQPLQEYEVKLYMTTQPFASAGGIYPSDDPVFADLPLVTECDQHKGTAVWREQFNGKMYLTPVVCKKKISLICQSIPVVQLHSVKRIQVVRRAGNLELSWEWPSGCKEILLVYRSDRYPDSPTDDTAGRITVQKKNYDRDKAFIMRQCGSQPYYLALYTMAKDAEEIVYSSPQLALSIGNASKSTIRYSLNRKRTMLFFGKLTITVEVELDGDMNALPELRVVKKIGRQPLRREDGILVLKSPASQTKSLSLSIPDNMIEPNAYFKLFLENKDDIQKFNLEHPGNDDMHV